MTSAQLEHYITGKVVSAKMTGTAVVEVETKKPHPKYGKYVRRTSKFYVDDPQSQCREGQIVIAKMSRKISKTKNWVLEKIVQQVAE